MSAADVSTLPERLAPGRAVGTRAVSEQSAHRVTMVAFTVASLLGSSLLFLVQPMVGRLLLPLAGGTPSLWNTAMVFFQGILLAGYLYSHLSISRLGVRRHVWAQSALVLAPLAVLPIAVPGGWRLPADASPALWTLLALTVMVGLPFFVLSTASTTFQRWFSVTDHPHAADPYFLYAAGNVGSLLSLVAYPLVIEPRLSLDQQARLWTGLYIAFAAATIGCAELVRRRRTPAWSVTSSTMDAISAPPIANRRRAAWVAAAFVPSALMLGVTRHIATDVASMPLLWIVPLVLYLVTFVVAFGRGTDAIDARLARWLRLGVVPLVLTLVGLNANLLLAAGVHLGWFFVATLLAHGRLAQDRPASERLTEFYTWISVGGVLGGIFAAMVAPVVFDRVLEYPIAIVLALLLADRGGSGASLGAANRAVLGSVAGGLGLAGWLRYQDEPQFAAIALAAIGVVALLALPPRRVFPAVVGAMLAVATLVPLAGLLHQDRSFFGVYQVRETASGSHELAMGTTVHGQQLFVDGVGGTSPRTYYHQAGPLGQVMGAMLDRDHVAVIGLGAGEIATYAEAGDHYTFYEIDPVVVEIAEDPALFTYLQDTAADVDIVVGDGRLALDTGAASDLLIVDAFSSDAIPVHLITTEAVALYLDSVREGGIVAMHISNRHFDLAPVLGRIGAELGVEVRHQAFGPSEADAATGASSTDWVLMAGEATALDGLDPRWTPAPTDGPLWTDDYADVLSILRL